MVFKKSFVLELWDYKKRPVPFHRAYLHG